MAPRPKHSTARAGGQSREGRRLVVEHRLRPSALLQLVPLGASTVAGVSLEGSPGGFDSR